MTIKDVMSQFDLAEHNKNIGCEKIITMSESEMIDLWNRRLNLVAERRNCIIERGNGTDLDAKVLQCIRDWYSRLLIESPSRCLPVEDIASKLNVNISSNNVVRVAIPDNCLRPVKWKMKSWKRPVTYFYEPDCYMASLQYDVHTRGGGEYPVGIIMPRQIMMYSASGADDVLEEALCVVHPAEGVYILAESLLHTIPNTLKTALETYASRA